MNNTINGMPLSDILAALTEPFEDKDFDNRDGYTFLPYKSFFKRMIDVVGIANYDFIISKSDVRQIANSYHLSVNGTLRIKSDSGSVISERSGNGGVDMIISDAKNCLNYKNAEEVAAQNAFCQCLKNYGVGVFQLWDKKKTTQHSTKPSTEKNTNIKTYSVEFLQTVSNMEKGYKSQVRVQEMQNQKMELIIWQEGAASIEQYMSMGDFQRKVRPKTTLHILGYTKMWKNKEQLVMTGIYGK